jgi:hypothetical protein
MDKNTMIRESFNYILCIEDAIARDIKVPYGDHSRKFFTKEELLKDLEFAYSKLHECLEKEN